ncbi:AraC family transcriptional regulator [Krasilnikovia sp. M28-CT-15]|uniref:AraC family transcriptional regulator n=1 Tax=Krasilnikovia sp. M28-CT-15 TaxID=3373540 RepID=UPI0038766EFB
MVVVFSSFETRDRDEARAVIEQAAFPLALEVLSSQRPYRCRYEQLAFGPLTVCRTLHTAGLRVVAADLQRCYLVGFCGPGRTLSHHRGAEVELTGACAAVYQPVGEVRSCSSGACLTYSVTIDQQTLESTLAGMLGRAVARPIRFGPAIDLTSPAGRGWSRLVRLLVAEAVTGDGGAAQPLVWQPLADAVLRGLLLAAEHPGRETLDRPVGSCRSGPVRRAVDAIHADPGRAMTLSTLAAVAQVSARALQQGFHQQLGTSPMGYLRQVRLACAHDELRWADPAVTGVAAVAHRWGFTHLGRFAASYRAVYGCAPSDTLHR